MFHPSALLFQADTKGVSVLKSEDFAAWYTQAPTKMGPCALLSFWDVFGIRWVFGHVGVSQNYIESISSFYYFCSVFFHICWIFCRHPHITLTSTGEGILEFNMM